MTARRIKNRPEQAQQLALFEWVRLHEVRYPILRLCVHTPNGGKRSRIEAQLFRRMGGRAGILDVLCLWAAPGYTGLAIELKAPGRGNDTSDAQDAMIDMLRNAGWRVAVCTHWSVAARLIAEHASMPAHTWPEAPALPTGTRKRGE